MPHPLEWANWGTERVLLVAAARPGELLGSQRVNATAVLVIFFILL